MWKVCDQKITCKVLHLLRKRNFLLKQSFKISVKKNIPHGSGLGSGSANAADLIKFFNLKMNLKDSVSPVLIEDASDKNSYYVIMPMKI